MFTRHRHAAIDELDRPDAVGTNPFSPQRPESFCHILLGAPSLSPRLLRRQGGDFEFPTDASRRIFESAVESCLVVELPVR